MNGLEKSFESFGSMNDTLILSLALICAGSMIGGLLTSAFIVTIAWRKIEQAEQLIATHGKQLDLIRYVWRNGPKGRMMRATHVHAFFRFRQIPRFGPTIAARLGDEHEPIPDRLKLWATLPMDLLYLQGITFFVTGGIGKALS